MNIDAETVGKLTQWAEQSGRSLKDLSSLFEKFYESLKVTNPQLNEEQLRQRARFLVYRDIKTARFTRAKPVDAIFFGFTQEYDITQGDRLFALELYKTNREKAINEGYTDETGQPLDSNPKTPWGSKNPNYGKPLAPRYIRQSVGIGRPAEGGDLKLLILTQIGDQAFLKPPLGKSVRFLANLRADEENRRLYNSSVQTKFEEIEMEEFGKVTTSTVCKILADAPEEFKTDLVNLQAWHMEHERDMRRIVIVEADVTFISRTPMSTGNYLMIVEDESLMDLEEEGITAFVHPQLVDMLDFGPGSRVEIVARTTIGPGYDRETRTTNAMIQRPILNVLGVWAIPEFKTPLEESRILEPSEDVEL